MDVYQDYVIKDGRFIGKFEEMYKKFDDPWHQSTSIVNSYSKNISLINIRKYELQSIVEFGCGMGYFTDFISRNTDAKVTGVDISSTAIKKARELWPNLDFHVDTVLNMDKYANLQALLFSEITWYILSDLERIFEMLLTHFKGKYLLHNLVFYKGTQEYGKDYFTSLKEFIEYVPFKLIGQSESTTIDHSTIDTSTIFKIEKK